MDFKKNDVEIKEEEEEKKEEEIKEIKEITFNEKMNELYLEILLEKEFRLKKEIDMAIIETNNQTQPLQSSQITIHKPKPNPNPQPQNKNVRNRKQKPKVNQKNKQNLNKQIQIAKVKNFQQKVLRLKSLQKLIEQKFNIKK
jgi:hypothetical protein